MSNATDLVDCVVVGNGRMGQAHVRVLQRLSQVRNIVVVDPKTAFTALGPESNVQYVRHLSDVQTRGATYAVVATPNSLHAETAKLCLERGWYCLIEKPLTHSADTARQFRKEIEAFESKVGVGHIERFSTPVREAKSRIMAGAIGLLTSIGTTRIGQLPQRITDVGVGLDLLTHDVDLATYLAADWCASVAATGQFDQSTGHDHFLAVTGLTSSGVSLYHRASWQSPIKKRQVEVFGTEGAIEIDLLSGQLTIFSSPTKDLTWDQIRGLRGERLGEQFQPALDPHEPLLQEHEDFIDFMVAGKGSRVTVREALRSVEVVDACIRSAKTNETIVLDAP